MRIMARYLTNVKNKCFTTYGQYILNNADTIYCKGKSFYETAIKRHCEKKGRKISKKK